MNATDTPTKSYLSPMEFQRIFKEQKGLHLNRHFLYSEIKKGRIKTLRLGTAGGAYRIPANQVREYEQLLLADAELVAQ